MSTFILSLTIDCHDCGMGVLHEGRIVAVTRPYMLDATEQTGIEEAIRTGGTSWDDPSQQNSFAWRILERDHYRGPGFTEEARYMLMIADGVAEHGPESIGRFPQKTF